MRRILIVCNTDQNAKRKFKEMVNLYGSMVTNALFNQLTIEVDDRQYQFISQSSHLEKITGQEYHTVIIDELVQLTCEQRAMIMSRERL